MNWSELWDSFASKLLAGLDPANCALRMRFLTAGGARDATFVAHSADILERLNEGIEGRLVAATAARNLPLNAFEGVPVEVQFTSDTGEQRVVRAIVLRVVRGMADDKVTLYQFALGDPLALLDRLVDTHICSDQSVVDVTDELLGGALKDCPGLGMNFTYTWRVDWNRYKPRAFWLRRNESLSRYLRTQWARFGISYFFRFDDRERLELVLFDDSVSLDMNAAGNVAFRRQDGLQKGDGISHFVEGVELTNGRTWLGSFDYKAAQLFDMGQSTRTDHGKAGQGIAAFLADRRITVPHVGDDWREFERMNTLRIRRHELEAAWACGISDVRQLAVGESNCIDELPGRPFPSRPWEDPSLRTYTFLEVHHFARNNLGELTDHLAQLLALSETVKGWAPMGSVRAFHREEDVRGAAYRNRFVAVLRGTPLVPRWDESWQAHRLQPLTAIIAGWDGEEVDIDEEGRVRVVIPGETTGRKTARVRFNALYAGNRQGVWLPLKVGMEVVLDFDGDESRPVIVRVHYNSANRPPLFDQAGSVKGNRFLAGMHLHEIGGRRYGELLFDLTTGQISVSLGSEHARSRLQLGALHGTRRNGFAPPIGEGFYLHTQAAGSLRVNGPLLLSAWGREKDSAPQLDMPEHLACLEMGNTLAGKTAQDAAGNQGLPMDMQPQTELHDAVAAAPGGSNIAPQSQGGAPTLNITAPAGIATSTPKTLYQVAGVNLAAVAGVHLQLTSGKSTVVNALQGISLFAHADGLRAIANQGPLLLQSRNGDTTVQASGDITIAAGGTLRLQGKEILLQTEDGAYIKLGGSVELGGSGPLNVKTGGHNWDGPNTMPATLPAFQPPRQVSICVKCLLNAAAVGSPVATY